MLKRLQSAGSLSAKVQRPDYSASIFKGGRVAITADVNGYALRYESSEVPRYLVKAWKAGEEDGMIAYLLKLADEGRWKSK